MRSREPQSTGRIYALRHPESGLTRFIENTLYLLPEKRYRILAVARHGDTSLRSRWIRTLLARGLEPTMVLLQENARDSDLSKWKKEYADELLENMSKRKPQHERSASEGAT